jgi:hypothetical protein
VPILSDDSLRFSDIVWTLKLLASKHKQAYGMLGHLPLPYRDQYMAL